MNSIKKGYTLTVKSWENDGDNSQTLSKTVDTIEEAKVWYDMMKLCESQNNQPAGVVKLGNSYGGFSIKQQAVAIEFMETNFSILCPGEHFEEVEDASDWFRDLAGELLGYGEDYDCRVMESCVVTYSPVDVIPEIINF